MKLTDAQSIIREVSGKSHDWLEAWGLGVIREAMRTIEDRVNATDADLEYVKDIRRKLYRKW